MFEELLQRIALGLKEAGIAYMVIGGQAVLRYGEPRLTKDIDVTLALGPDEGAQVIELARHLNWKILPSDPLQFIMEAFVLPVEDIKSGIRSVIRLLNGTRLLQQCRMMSGA